MRKGQTRPGRGCPCPPTDAGTGRGEENLSLRANPAPGEKASRSIQSGVQRHDEANMKMQGYSNIILGVLGSLVVGLVMWRVTGEKFDVRFTLSQQIPLKFVGQQASEG